MSTLLTHLHLPADRAEEVEPAAIKGARRKRKQFDDSWKTLAAKAKSDVFVKFSARVAWRENERRIHF